MPRNDLQAVILRKINVHAQKDLEHIFEVLRHDYDDIISRQLFPVIDAHGEHFDFWDGFMCGSVSKVAGKAILTDLMLSEIHLL